MDKNEMETLGKEIRKYPLKVINNKYIFEIPKDDIQDIFQKYPESNNLIPHVLETHHSLPSIYIHHFKGREQRYETYQPAEKVDNVTIEFEVIKVKKSH